MMQKELDRIDLKHHVMMLLCNGYLHLAPLVNPKRILDIGTGTGIWAIEMGEQYPEAEVKGIDLSPVQPAWYASGFYEDAVSADMANNSNTACRTT